MRSVLDPPHKGRRQAQSPEYRAVNPQIRVPSLEVSDGEILTQSLAIIEYLDEIHPEPPLLPTDATARAKVRAMAQIDRLRYPSPEQFDCPAISQAQLKHKQAEIDAWYAHWVTGGFGALETMLSPALTLRVQCHAR